MKYKHLIIIIVLILVYYIYRLKNASQNLAYSLGTISGVNISHGSLSWYQTINIFNGDTIPIPINSISLNNVLNGNYVGNSVLLNSIILKAHSTTPMTVKVVIPYSDFPNLVLAILGSIKSYNLDLAFKGYINSIGISMPINQHLGFNLMGLKNLINK